MAEVTFTKTKRGQVAVIYNGYYHVRAPSNRYRSDESVIFACRSEQFPGCSGKVRVNLITEQYLGFEEHNHPSDEARCQKQMYRQKLNENVLASPKESVSKVYGNQLKRAHDHDESHLVPALRGCERNLRKKRRLHKAFDEAKQIDDIDITGAFGQTQKGANFVLGDFRTADPPQDLLVFATDEFIRLLATEVPFVHMDGTFKASPNLFYQLFVIHGMVGFRQIPLVYAFMRKKDEASYAMVFRCVREKILEFYPDFDFRSKWMYVMSDFERAISNAGKLVFPGLVFKGCFFHHCQAVYRYVCNELGYAVLYREKGPFYQFCRKLMGLALLPPDRIEATFRRLCDVEQGYDERVARYYQDVWLRSFGVELFSVWSLPERTNNKVEGWHNRINKSLVQRKKKGVHETIRDVVKEEQHENEALVHRFRHGLNITVPRKKVYVEMDWKIQDYSFQLRMGELTELEFVRRVSFFSAEFADFEIE